MIAKIPVKDIIEDYFAKKEYQNPTTLCALMMAFGSDKGGPEHNYTTLYSKLFTPWRNEEINVFEIGIEIDEVEAEDMKHGCPPGYSSSLRGWASFFPKGNIYGADINRDKLFNEARIKTFFCDQTNPQSIQNMFAKNELQNIQFDIMLDDALHEFKPNLTFLLNSFDKLKSGGIYIIEDLQNQTADSFLLILDNLKTNLSIDYIDIANIPLPNNRTNNTLLIIQK